MGLTAASKGTINSGTNADSYAFGAFTPSGNTPILVVGVAINGTSPIASISDSQSNVWVSANGNDGAANSIHVWYTESPAVASTVITVSFVGGTGAVGEVIEVPYGTFRQVGASTAVSTATLQVGLASAFLTSSAGICFAFGASNPLTVSPPADWTELSDIGHAAPAFGMESAIRNSGETGSTITWGTNSPVSWRAIVVEVLDNSPAAAVGRFFRSLLGVGR